MCGLNDCVVCAGDARALLSRVLPPQDEHDRIGFRDNRVDHCIGERLPTFAVMTSCFTRTNCEHRVEEEHTLIGPMLQAAVCTWRNSDVVLTFTENVAQ